MSLWYDLIILFLLLGGLATGFGLGLVRQTINVLGLYFGLVFASYYHPIVTRFVRTRFGETDSLGRETALFFVLFAIIWAFVNVGAFFSFRQAPRFLPATLDRLAGMVLGLLTGFVVAVIVTLLLNYATSVEWPQNNGLRLFIDRGIDRSTLRVLLFNAIPLLADTIEPWVPRGLPNFFTVRP